MAMLLLCVWLLAACSARAVPIQVRRNFRHGTHVNFLIPNSTVTIGNDVACGVTLPVSEKSDMNERCPESCPLYVEDKSSTVSCDFACVGNNVQSCKAMNPKTPVPDLERGECRRCEVVGCDVCLDDGTDRCAKCLRGYVVNSYGQCRFSGPWLVGSTAIYLMLLILVIGIVFVVWWIVDLSMRDDSNKEGLQHSLDLRSRAKIHQPKKGTGERKLWPMNTNLCKQDVEEDVAGPAVRLLFSFQAAVIIWAFVLALVWWCLGTFVDSDMMILGTRGAETARQDCINVKWGYHTMHRLMWAKIGFLEFAYFFSFIGALLFGIRQRRLYEVYGLELSTHQDFAAILRGLPELNGDEEVEKELEDAVKKTTDGTIIGASVGWQINDETVDTLQSAMDTRLLKLEKDLLTPRTLKAYGEREAAREAAQKEIAEAEAADNNEGTAESSETGEKTGCGVWMKARWAWLKARLHQIFIRIEKFFVHPVTQRVLSRGRRKAGLTSDKPDVQAQTTEEEELEDPPNAGRVDSVRESQLSTLEALKGLKTSSTAFIVFETQEDRDRAVENWNKVPMEFRGKALKVEVPTFEPAAVLWQNLGPETTMKTQCKRGLGMFGFVSLMIGLLCAFEILYYYVQQNQVYATGEETISLSFIITTAGVAGMMAVLCVCSAEVADRAAFERVGSRETCFVILYTFSVILQVSLDLAIAYWIGKHLLDVNEIYTFDGRKIADMDPERNFVDIFETYAMQKQLGVTVLSFGFPCAFLLPFLAEPLVSILLPYKIMSLIVGCHPEMSQQQADGYLEAVPMDLGRYGDIMINVIVGSLILWFPGGFTFTIFMFLTCSHLYIYWYDHWRVLRIVQNIYISSFSADLLAQWLFAVPCAIIAAALVFKSNCNEESSIAKYALPATHLHHLGLWGSQCDDGHQLIFKVLLTFFCHLALHSICLGYFVPYVSRALTPAPDEEVAKIPYKETAGKYPCSWFSANLIHCLRSEYIYKHNTADDPPFDCCVSGKEHLMRYNPKIGAFFEDELAEGEVYSSFSELASTTMKTMKTKFSFSEKK